MKKIALAALAAAVCLCLGGCVPDTPLTETEMDAVAEYAAELLLKYDEKFNYTLLVPKDVWEVPSPTPTVIPTSTPGLTPEPTPTVTPSGVIEVPTPPEETTRQLAKVLGVEDFSVTCDYFELKQEVISNGYFSLDAKEGRQYVVLHFTITNTSDETKVFDASEQNLECAIDVNHGTISKVSLSMLENDMRHMEITVPANSSADAVLVFEISAKAEITSINFSMMNQEDDSVFVKLK